ncbi:MAG: hypothetical protein ABWY39_06025 [Mycobacterium sp.]
MMRTSSSAFAAIAAQHQFRTAENEYRKALRLLEGVVDERHPTRVALREGYSDLLCELGRDCEAAELAFRS